MQKLLEKPLNCKKVIEKIIKKPLTETKILVLESNYHIAYFEINEANKFYKWWIFFDFLTVPVKK